MQYLKIYRKLIEMNFAILVTYRENLFNNIITSVSWAVFSYASIFILTSQMNAVFGWKRGEIVLLTAIYGIIIGLFHTCFTRNFEKLPALVQYGKLDMMLTKPIDSQFFTTCSTIGFTALVRVLMGVVTIPLILISLKMQVPGMNYVLCIAMIIAGLSLVYSLWLIAVTALFWNPRLSNIIDIMFSVTGMSRFPSEMYKQVSRELFIALLPITFIAVTPTKTLLSSYGLYDIGGLIGFAGVFLLISRLFWRYALKFYTSASS